MLYCLRSEKPYTASLIVTLIWQNHISFPAFLFLCVLLRTRDELPGTHEFLRLQDVWHAYATIYPVGVAYEDTLLVWHCKEAKGKVAPRVERTA